MITVYNERNHGMSLEKLSCSAVAATALAVAGTVSGAVAGPITGTDVVTVSADR